MSRVELLLVLLSEAIEEMDATIRHEEREAILAEIKANRSRSPHRYTKSEVIELIEDRDILALLEGLVEDRDTEAPFGSIGQHNPTGDPANECNCDHDNDDSLVGLS